MKKKKEEEIWSSAFWGARNRDRIFGGAASVGSDNERPEMQRLNFLWRNYFFFGGSDFGVHEAPYNE